jgi:hypothetical protein
MSPTHYSRFAERAVPLRWWLGACSVCGFALVAPLALYANNLGMQMAAIVAGPLIGLPWGALCAAIWFHPERGNMQPNSRLVGRLPEPVQTGLRWYATGILSVSTLFCAVLWPLFVLVSWAR